MNQLKQPVVKRGDLEVLSGPDRNLTHSPPTALVPSEGQSDSAEIADPERGDGKEDWEKKELDYKATIQLLRSQLENVKVTDKPEKKKTWTLGNLLTINVLPPSDPVPISPVSGHPDSVAHHIHQLQTQLHHHKTLSGTTQAELALLKEDLDRIRKEREKEKKDVEYRIKKVKWEMENKLELAKSGAVVPTGTIVNPAESMLAELQKQVLEKDAEIGRLKKHIEEMALDQRIARQRSKSRSRPPSPVKQLHAEELEMWTNKCHALEVQLHLLQRQLADQTTRNVSLKNLIVSASLGPSTPATSTPSGLAGDALVLANYAELQKQATSMKAELDKVKLKNEEMSFVMGQLVDECERLEKLVHWPTGEASAASEANVTSEASVAVPAKLERKGSDLARKIMSAQTSVDLSAMPVSQASTPRPALMRKASTSLLIAKRLAGDATVRPDDHCESFVNVDVRNCCKKCGEDNNPSKFIVL